MSETVEDESAETLADREKVEAGYAFVNAMWKTQGAVATLRYVHHLPHGRALPLGLDLAEVDRVIASCDSFYRGGYRDWPTQWFKAGDQYLERGREALDGRTQRDRRADAAVGGASATTSPATCITTSAVCYPRRSNRCCAPWRFIGRRRRFLAAVDPSRSPYDDTVLRPFLRLPRGVERPPCVILIGGANSNMINMHAVSEYYLDRGMATVGFDGPGQGEFRARTGRVLRVEDFDRALSAVATSCSGTSASTAIVWAFTRGRRDAARDPCGRPGQAFQSGRGPSRRVSLRQLLRAGVRAHAGFASAGDVQLPGRQDVGGGHASRARAAHAGRRCGPSGFSDPVGLLGGRRDHAYDRIDNLEAARQRPSRDRDLSGKGHGGPSRLSLPLEADWMRDRLLARSAK